MATTTPADPRTRLTPARVICDLQTAATPRISPDGTRIAFVLGTTDTKAQKSVGQVWLIDPDGGNARQLTQTGTSHSSPVWSPDGKHLAFVSRRDGDKPNAVCLLPMEGGEARELVRHRASPGSLAWSPDGGQLAYPLPVDPDNPDESEPEKDAPPSVRAVTRIDYKQDNRGFLNDTRMQVMLVAIESAEIRQLTREAVDHTDPQWSPDARTIAVKVPNRNGMHSQLGLVDVASGNVKLVGPEDGVLATWAWSRDGSFILFDGDDQNTAQTDYFRYDVNSGERRRLTDDLGFSPESGFPTISSPAQPVWLDDRTALVHAIEHGASGLWTVDAESGDVTEVTRWDATHAGLSADARAQVIVQARSTLDGIGELMVFDHATGETREITSFNAGFFAATPPAKWETFSIERAGETIEAWLFMPHDFDPSRSYPVVLDVHGGPHGNYGYSFNVGAQVLADAGMLVIASNPRGSGTYGRHFANLVRGDWGGEDWLDLLAVLDAVLERPYADASRTGIYGYSYGGYMTSWAIGQTNRFRAAVCGAPVFDFESFYGTSDIGHVFGEMQWGGTPRDRMEWMIERSPATHAHKATTPTLIVHGEADDRCPIGQGEQMFVALKKAGVDVEFVRYPGGSHLMLRGGPIVHKIDYYTRVVDWFRKHLLDT
jgi:dipeptidyl aminopeptidase/acylaminoacyl peptidase